MSRDLKRPKVIASEHKIKKIISNNKLLIQIFNKHSESIIEYFNFKDILILITDSNGMVLSKYYSNNLSNNTINHIIKKGVYLTEESCGTNAVSLAMIKNNRVIASKNDYFCSFFQEFGSLAEPICMNQKILGFLNILTTHNIYTKKYFLILDHLSSKISLDYIKNIVFKKDENQLLNDVEYEVLKYTALGYSISKISEILKVSESTIKYRRKLICEKLEAHNIIHAISISYENNILRISI